MTTYAYVGRDGPNGLALRKTVRERHLGHLAGLNESGQVVFAGPLRNEAGEPCGSLIILQADDFPSAQAIAEADPYLVEGVFANVEVFETSRVFPEDEA